MYRLNVLYTTDHNYVKPMTVSLCSLLMNNVNKQIDIHLVYSDLTQEDFDTIENIVNMFDNAHLFLYNFKDFECHMNEFNIPKWRGSRIANARLFYSFFLPDIENLLYLDSDTIVIGNLNGLDEFNNPLNMAKDAMTLEHLKELGIYDGKYYNSGVIWFKPKLWEKESCDNLIYYALNKKINIKFPDQDLLNIALKDKIGTLPTNYNVFPLDTIFSVPGTIKFYERLGVNSRTEDELKEERNNPIILHATPVYDVRPWQENIIHPFNKEYDKYCKIVYGCLNKETRPIIKDYILYLRSIMSTRLLSPEQKDNIKKLMKYSKKK